MALCFHMLESVASGPEDIKDASSPFNVQCVGSISEVDVCKVRLYIGRLPGMVI